MSLPPQSSGFASGFGRRAFLFQVFVLLALLACAPFAGPILSIEDPLEKADAIFVLAGSRAERWLEARDLLKEGYAPHILLSAGLHEEAETVLAREGLHMPSEAEFAKKALVTLGVPESSVTILEGRPDNTSDEGELLRTQATARGWRTVIVVTSKLHTRRAALAMRRALKGTPVRVVMRATRYDDTDPARWWQRRRTIREVVYEVPKLIAYTLGF
jgi:uncharacterized SAM-binding protein YcdF (DUF218 family)